MSEVRKKLAGLSNGKTGKASERLAWRKQNAGWLKKSQAIAVRVLMILRQKGMSQQALADQLKVSPQQVSKIVKGSENLTLDTICALEKALDVLLMDVPRQTKKMPYHMPNWASYKCIEPGIVVKKHAHLYGEVQFSQSVFDEMS